MLLSSIRFCRVVSRSKQFLRDTSTSSSSIIITSTSTIRRLHPVCCPGVVPIKASLAVLRRLCPILLAILRLFINPVIPLSMFVLAVALV